MSYVYLIISLKDKRWYTGYTNDLRKRISEHNKGLVLSTKSRKPFKLAYYESCINMLDARARERFLKSGPGKAFLRRRLKFFFNKDFNGL